MDRIPLALVHHDDIGQEMTLVATGVRMGVEALCLENLVKGIDELAAAIADESGGRVHQMLGTIP